MLGAETYLYLNIENISLTARVDGKNCFECNSAVKLKFDEERIHLFNKDTELAIR